MIQKNSDPTPIFAEAAARASVASGHAVSFDRCFVHQGSDLFAPARFRLANGMTIILMIDRRAPVFSYQTWFKVGSRDELAERTGMAHLLEHMMFKGTAEHPTGEMDREMELRGAQTNAATWVDWTYYTEALACRDDNLATVIDYEADRMTRLIIEEESFASELEVVKNERRAGVEDSVAGALSERLLGLAFERHPYRWPTLGTMASLEGIGLAHLRDFYRSFYAPNNAVLVLVGDLDPAEALGLVARRYGPLARQAITRPDRPEEPRQTEPRQAVIERQVVTPQIAIGFHAPAQLTDDHTALELLHDALLVGDSGRLYRRLVTERSLAIELDGYVSPFAEPGLFELLIAVRDNVDPELVVEAAQAELDALSEGLTERELNKARNNVELGLLESLRDAESCAESLGHYETNYGDFTLAFSGLELLDRVRSEDLQRVAAEVFRRDNRSVVIAK